MFLLVFFSGFTIFVAKMVSRLLLYFMVLLLLMRSLATLLLTKREKSELEEFDAKSGRLQNLQNNYSNLLQCYLAANAAFFLHWNFL
jgi:flagellar biosynthesis/type III secretory pathway M-ring protein FliF/YscJ